MSAKIRILNPINSQNYIRPKDAERVFVSKGRGIIEIIDGKSVFRFTDSYFQRAMRLGVMAELKESASAFNSKPVRQVGNSRRAPRFVKSIYTGPTAEELHWRQAVLLRDGYKCVFCGSTENLEADHIKPKSVFPDLKYDVSNGRTLCNPCHRQTDTYGGRTHGIVSVTPMETVL